MLSVGIFSYSCKPRGSVVHAACLAEALWRTGVDVTLYALAKPGDQFYRPLSCAVRLIPAQAAPESADALIQQRISEFRIGIRGSSARHDIYHAEDCLAANALVAERAELGDAALVRTVHHVERFESSYLMACQEQSVILPDLVLSVSQVTSRDVLRTFGRSASSISNGVDVQRFAAPDPHAIAALRQRIQAHPEDGLILSVGGVEPRKNSLIGLDAIALAYARHPSLRWLIVGGASIWEHDDYRREFSRRLALLPRDLRARISLFGSVPEAELTTLYQASDILLCPSLQEGFGLCVLEALAARAAAIVPKGAPFDEYLGAGSASFVDPASAEDIACAVLQLLQNSELRERQVRAGHVRAQRYSWELVAERHLARYESVLSRAEPPRVTNVSNRDRVH